MGIPMANGTTLLAAVPVYAGHSEPRQWVVVVDRGADSDAAHRFVLSRMNTLDAPHWGQGYYYHTAQAAMAAFYLDAGVYSLSEEAVREAAMES